MGQPGAGGIGEDVDEVTWDGLGEDGDLSMEALEPDEGPVLGEKVGDELEVTTDTEPLGQLKFQQMLDGGEEESASPSAAGQMG